MPVVVTGADRPLGRAVVLAFLADGAPEVRAVVRDRAAAGALRAAGARVAVSDLSDPLRLGAVLAGAHTVVHLDTGPDGAGSPLLTWDWLAEAAEGTGVRLVVTVLPPGVRPPAPPAGGGPGVPGRVLVVAARDRLDEIAGDDHTGAETIRDILRADSRR